MKVVNKAFFLQYLALFLEDRFPEIAILKNMVVLILYIFIHGHIWLKMYMYMYVCACLCVYLSRGIYHLFFSK